MISTLLPMLSFSEINGTRPGLSVAALNRAHIHMTEHKIYTAKKGGKKDVFSIIFTLLWKIQKKRYFGTMNVMDRISIIWKKNHDNSTYTTTLFWCKLIYTCTSIEFFLHVPSGLKNTTYTQQKARRFVYLSNGAITPPTIHTMYHTPSTERWMLET